MRTLAVVTLLVLSGCGAETLQNADNCSMQPLTLEEISALAQGEEEDTVLATVMFTSEITDEDREFLRQQGARIMGEWTHHPYAVVRIPTQALEAVARYPRVRGIALSVIAELDC